MNRFFALLLLALYILPVSAQTDNSPVPITLSNAADLTLLAMLELDISTIGGSAFPNIDIEWSSNGEWFAIGYNTMVYVYDAQRLQDKPVTFDINFDYVETCGSRSFYTEIRDIAFHPTRAIVAVTNPERLYIYDLQTGLEIGLLENFPTDDIAFLDDGSLLIIEMDGTVSNLDVDSMALTDIENIELSSSVYIDPASVEVAADGRIFTTTGFDVLSPESLASNEITSFVAPSCELPQGRSGDCANIPVDVDMLAVNGDRVATIDSGVCTAQDVNIWDMSSTELLSELPHSSRFVTLSADGNLIATDGEGDSGIASLYDTSTGDLVTNLPAATDTFDASFSPDGSILATISQSGLVQLWTVPENMPARADLQALSSVIIDASCDVVQYVSAGTTVSIGWSWYAKTAEQIADHIENVNYDLAIDGLHPQRWIFLSQMEQYDPHGADTRTVFYYMPVGDELPGNHVFSYTLNWTNTINDGFSTFGPDGETMNLSGTCDYVIG